MSSLRLVFLALIVIAGTSPVFAQHPHPGGGPPSGGSSSAASGSAAGGQGMSNRAETPGASSMMHASPSAVLSQNTVIADKVKTLTGEDAATACSGFKNLGQCVAAAHVAKNLNIPGGFDAVKAKMTGTGSVNLGKAISQLVPTADAKSEATRANKQAEQDLSVTNT
jgi:hypothetical protein